MIPCYSLFDLNEYIRRVVALNFQQAVWIAAEIAQVGQSKGHYYLDLVQKGPGDDIVAQSQAVLWASDYRRLRAGMGAALDAILRDGLEVKMQVRVDYHERYGLKLIITDLDPAYSFGQIELRRRQVIRDLQEQGLLERNRSLPLSPALQRIAVVSSEGAAGFQDFREHLAQNAFGYRFHCRLFASAVQGKSAGAELSEALEQIALQHTRFDAVAIVRGGGARLDLAAFDDIELCKKVAQMPLPVFSGIGHDADETVLDLVAHTALKTPTAVADQLIQHNLFFENALLQLADNIRSAGQSGIRSHALDLERLETAANWKTNELLRNKAQQLIWIEQHLPAMAAQILRNRDRQLEQMEAVCAALHPDNVLRRGYSLTLKDGKILQSASDAEPGDLLETRLQDGVLLSRVE